MKTDVCRWNLEFSFREARACKKFIKKLTKLPFVLKFTYDQYFENVDNVYRYRIQIEGTFTKSLLIVSNLMKKVENIHE